MTLKKMLLLVTIALTTAALVPAAAQAQWLHEGEALKGAAGIELSGGVKLEVTGGHTYECAVLIGATLIEGSTGSVNSFEPAGPTCVGTGAVKGCELVSSTSTVPWVIHGQNFGGVIDAKVTNVTFSYKFKGCATPGAHVEFKEITLTPDNAAAFSSFTLSGAEGGAQNAKVSGQLFLTNNQQTYGIN